MRENENTYWNSRGELQKEYNTMLAADFTFTKASQRDFHRYYRYYNDGDQPRGIMGADIGSALERIATERIAQEWKRFNKMKGKKKA